MGRVIPKEWMPRCQMFRIIVHWTAGGTKATELDRKHYHVLLEGSGKVVRGIPTIKDNARPLNEERYAAHTRNCNAGAIGVAMCGMMGATESPFNPGPQPMTKKSWDQMIKGVAELCLEYNIPVTMTTVLGHGEVQKNLKIKQLQKWDPMKLPWAPELTPQQVGHKLRNDVLFWLNHLKNGGG